MVRSLFAHGSIANIMTWPRCIIVPAYNTTYSINIWSSRSEIYVNIFYQSNILRSTCISQKVVLSVGFNNPSTKTFSICTETGLVKSCQTLRALHIKMDYRTQNMQYPCFFICYLSHFQLHVCFQATNTRGS